MFLCSLLSEILKCLEYLFGIAHLVLHFVYFILFLFFSSPCVRACVCVSCSKDINLPPSSNSVLFIACMRTICMASKRFSILLYLQINFEALFKWFTLTLYRIEFDSFVSVLQDLPPTPPAPFINDTIITTWQCIFNIVLSQHQSTVLKRKWWRDA